VGKSRTEHGYVNGVSSSLTVACFESKGIPRTNLLLVHRFAPLSLINRHLDVAMLNSDQCTVVLLLAFDSEMRKKW